MTLLKTRDKYLIGGMIFITIIKISSNDFDFYSIFSIIIMGSLTGYIVYKLSTLKKK